MTRRIRILPGGREFVSEGNSTLLEAGLSSGLALGYACSNGNCGQCLARIISGEVKKVRHHDYRVSQGLEDHQRVLMCCNVALTDVVLEAAEARSAGEIPHQHITARVKNIQLVNDNIGLLHLKTPRTNRFRFLAGQHVQLGGNGIPVATYSISSCPCDDMNLHFQLPRLAGDAFSDHVFSDLKKGDPIDLNGPGGEFILDDRSARPPVFIAWRTGFGPIRSLVEQAIALEVVETIRLVWIAASKEDRYFDNLCRSWQDALDNFEYIPVDTDVKSTAIDIESLIREHLNIEPSELAGHDFYVAGNVSLLDACRTSLLSHGLPAEQLILDTLEHD